MLIYQREPGRLSVVGVWPESMRVKGRAASASTLATLSHGGPSYVLDALEVGSAAAADVVRDAAALAADLGWPGVQSLLVIPVIVDDRPVGAVKLLTRASGRYIDRASFLVAKAITARVAVELVRWARYQRLSTLNTMASELAAAGPGRFEREVATRLDVWAQRYIDASVHTLVIASIDGVRLKVFSSCGDICADVFQHDNDAWLQALLAGWLANPLVVPDARGLTLGARAGAQTVHFERVPLPPGRGVAAWLLLFAERSFTREDVAAAHEAARELMIFFDHERQRHLWSLGLARATATRSSARRRVSRAPRGCSIASRGTAVTPRRSRASGVWWSGRRPPSACGGRTSGSTRATP